MKRMLLCGGILFILLTGCNQTDQAEENLSPDHVQHVKDSDPNPLPEASMNEIAKHLSELASRVPDVDEATAIIAGPYAIVAIDVNDTLDRARVGTVKYSVSEALYKDVYGKTAVVIADADIVERFRQMNRKIAEGYPVQGIVDELAAIVGRYMPVMPNNQQPPPEVDQNKQQLQDEDEEKLEDIQEDHSNSDKYE